jgi:predicted metal-dependent peptidase
MPKKPTANGMPVKDFTQMKLTPEIKAKAKKLCEDAQTIILWRDKLYSSYVLSTKFQEEAGFPAAMGICPETTHLVVFYNPLLFEAYKLTILDVVEVLKHEYSHIILHHCWVALPDHTKDNIAADIEINQDPWVNVGKSAFIKEHACTYDKYEGLETQKARETYYNQLKDPDKKLQGASGNGSGQDEGTPSPVDGHKEWKPDPTTEEVWRRITNEVLEEAKTQGYLGGDAIEYIEAKWQKVKPLDRILKRIVQRHFSISITEGETRLRPNRRFPLLPGVRDQYGPKIVWAVDTSGSMSSKELGIILSVIRWQSKRMPVDVIQCDAGVTDVIKNATPKKLKKVGLKGRGGTSFKPVFEHITEKYKNRIDLLIFATDLCGDFPETKPPYKTIWLATTNDAVPFGEVVRLRPGNK